MGSWIHLIVLAVGATGIFLLDRGSAGAVPVGVRDLPRVADDDNAELEYRPALPRSGETPR